MTSSGTRLKDPRQVEGGRLGAFRRWGPPRVVRIDDFEDAERAAIVADIESRRAERAAARALAAARAVHRDT
jgi:hypothetical protein